MKRETVLKILLVLIMGVVLFVRPINVYAAIDLNTDYFEDQGSRDDIVEEETEDEPKEETNKTDTNTTTNTNTNTNTTTNTNNSNKDIPKAGLAEDTMMVVSIVALVAIAGYAFKKVNDYKNI